MALEPTFTAALANEVKLHMSKDKQKKYYKHVKQFN